MPPDDEYFNFPPGPRSRPPLHHARAFRRDPIGFITALRAEYGKLVSVRIGPMRFVLVMDAEIISDVLVRNSRAFVKPPTLARAKRLLGEGLITSEGALHDFQNKLLRGIFKRERIECYVVPMRECAADLSAAIVAGRPFDMAESMRALAMRVVGRMLFGTDFDRRSSEIVGHYTRAMESLRPFSIGVAGIPRVFEHVPFTAMWRFHRAKRALDDIVVEFIRRSGDAASDGNAIIAAMRHARSEEEDSAIAEGPLSNAIVRDNTISLLMAGHETVAHALAWTWYLLARHPAIEERLHREVDSLPASAQLDVDAADSLTYAHAVLRESMRLYPPIWVIGRRATVPVRLGDYLVPQGTTISMSQFFVHRDPDYYEAPEKFQPERWLAPEPVDGRAYFPFGRGPRACIGEKLGWLEATVVLAALARVWRFELAQDADVALDPGFSLRPRHGIRMLAVRRHG